MSEIVLIGRSSSHFTRIARIFAHELGVKYAFSPVYEITSLRQSEFADNPTLRVPSLRSPSGTLFGTVNICRELARLAARKHELLWPEDLSAPAAGNAQEIILDTMAAEVTLVMARATKLPPEHAFLAKPVARVTASVTWLERELPAVLASLPPHTLSLLEVSAFCLARHLVFREILSLDDRPNLSAFADEFGKRPSALATEYAFDQPA